MEIDSPHLPGANGNIPLDYYVIILMFIKSLKYETVS